MEAAEHKEVSIDGTFGHNESPEWKAAERRLVRKLDLTLMPIVWILYMFNYLDRNNIALVPRSFMLLWMIKGLNLSVDRPDLITSRKISAL